MELYLAKVTVPIIVMASCKEQAIMRAMESMADAVNHMSSLLSPNSVELINDHSQVSDNLLDDACYPYFDDGRTIGEIFHDEPDL